MAKSVQCATLLLFCADSKCCASEAGPGMTDDAKAAEEPVSCQRPSRLFF